ncbi:MAG: hypothetical protein HBSAPP03_05850 [Phycisphaerae bacterium]|nr:MAG: hypothetical protein HBSAPP03_05850 [Phycisphaerae bacterium]
MSGPWFFYADERTASRLRDPGQAVVMVGSFMGYPNFGDILQLKGALRWHAAQTGCTPILILDVDAITDDDYPARVRRNYGVESLVFFCTYPLTNPPAGLALVPTMPAIPNLHLYGGGFLNPLWGDFLVSLVEGVYAAFGSTRYLVSGQQVDPAFRDAMAAHFTRCPPILAGGRDPTSAKVLASCGVRAAFSFDDATECAADIAAALTRNGEPGGPHALVHLNASGYTRSDGEAAQLATLLDRLVTLRDHLGPQARFTLLQAYTDRRTYDIADTLGVVQLLDDTFPLREYGVLHLDRIAMDLGREGWDRGLGLTPAPTIALTSSYHVSMLCAMMGVPCWMEGRNDYYRQKRSGLGHEHADFRVFLANPTAATLADGLAARSVWLERLSEAWAAPSPAATLREAPSRRVPPARAWTGKQTVAKLREHLLAWAKDAEASAVRAHARATELGARLGQVEGAFHEEKETARLLRAQIDDLGAQVRDLAAARDATAAELDGARREVRTLGEALDAARGELVRVRAELGGELASWKAWANDLEGQLARDRARLATLEDLCGMTIQRLRRMTA